MVYVIVDILIILGYILINLIGFECNFGLDIFCVILNICFFVFGKGLEKGVCMYSIL